LRDPRFLESASTTSAIRATLALRAGVPVKVVSERLGHSSTSFTMDTYQHVLPGMREDAAELVAALVSGGRADD
jgi:integrase